MKPTRRELEDALRAEAGASAPNPDAAFVARLERRLIALDLDAPPVLRRRLTRVSGVAAIAATLTFVGAAAAAGIVITAAPDHRGPGELPPVTPSTIVDPQVLALSSSIAVPSSVAATSTLPAPTASRPTSTAPPVTTISSTSSTTATTNPPVVVGSSAVPSATSATVTVPTAPIDVPAVEVTVVETTAVEVTAVPTTEAAATPTTAGPATTTTEVHTPATLLLSCALAPGGVSCSWSAGPYGTVTYVLLRSTPSGWPGRSLFPPPGATSFFDATVTPGTTYVYLVHARDAEGASLGHSGAVQLDCCL